MVEQAIAGRAVVSVAGSGDTTLTTANNATDQSRPAILEWTGVVTGNANVICPTVSKVYIVFNNTTGAFTRTLKTAAGSGILVPQGKKMLLYSDGTNVVEQISAATAFDVLGVLTARGAIDESAGANIASASTTNIFATDGNYIAVTGTTGITSFGTAARAGARRRIKFTGILTLTNGANLILPTGANVITQANDVIEVIAETTTQHRVTDYMRADGSALAATGISLGGTNAWTGANTWANTSGFNNTVTLTAALNEAAFVDVASASTTNIGAAASNHVRITGAVTITSFGTIGAGVRRIVRFAGALTLTHNAASLILPSTTNITTAADDTATFVSLGSGNWLCTDYKRADGTAVASSGGFVPNSRTITAGTGLSGGGDLSANRTISMANTAVVAGAYTHAAITVDAQGRLTAAANGDLSTLVPTSRTISAGTGMTGGGDLSANRTLTLANTAVTPASYTATNLTVDAQGRITAASNGAAAPSAATQANQEAATSTTTYVSPGRQHFHPGHPKSWVNYDSTPGTPVITSSYDVTSLTDNAAGDITVNFTTAYSAADYTGGAMAEEQSASFNVFMQKKFGGTYSTTAIQQRLARTDGGHVDVAMNGIIYVGDK